VRWFAPIANDEARTHVFRMADNLRDRGAADRSRINIHEAHELRYWTKALDVTEEQLKAAVARVGVMAADVRRHLGK
jgi:hypothetical protein